MLLRHLVIASLMIVGCATAAQDEEVVESRRYSGPVRISDDITLQHDSRCYSLSGDVIDLRDMLFLRNTTLEPSARYSPYRVTVEDERVIITELSGDDEIIRAFRVDHIVSPNEDIDVDLTLTVAQNRLFVHWRETFQHQRYRQGLFRLNGNELEIECSGVSGIVPSH